MPRPELEAVPAFYHNYVKRVEEDNVKDALLNNWENTVAFLQDIAEEKWDYRYAEAKWTIKEVVQHLIDTERIFAYRALCFARGEATSLPGFDENEYAAASNASSRNKNELLHEFNIVRQSTLLLFHSFNESQLTQTGKANNNSISVNSIGFITAGHAIHHLAILNERYL